MTQLSLMYPARSGACDTSRAAATSMAGKTEALRARVYARVFGLTHGATCDELEASLHMSHQTCSARVRELVLLGQLVDTGLRRPTRSGRNARVYRTVGP